MFDPINGQEAILTVDIIDDIKYEPASSLFSITISVDENAKPLGVILGDKITSTISIIDNDSESRSFSFYCCNYFNGIEFRECEEETDKQWSVRWNRTKPRSYDDQKCPGELSFGIKTVHTHYH